MGTYIERMAPDETHAHRLPREHAVLGIGGFLLRLVEPIGLLEKVPRVERIGHCALGRLGSTCDGVEIIDSPAGDDLESHGVT